MTLPHTRYSVDRLHSTDGRSDFTFSEMAFDRPIDADRIDDFNLFSAFVRAPLWILGGVLGGNRASPSTADGDDELDGALPRIVPKHHENIPPLTDPMSKQDSGKVTLATVPSDEDCSSSCSCMADMKRKNLSWSDESGKNLVEYNDEVSKPISFIVSLTGVESYRYSFERS